MKKKYSVAPKDKKDWITFTKHLVNVYDKDAAFLRQNTTVNKIGEKYFPLQPERGFPLDPAIVPDLFHNAASVKITIKHKPPSWASHYQIVYTGSKNVVDFMHLNVDFYIDNSFDSRYFVIALPAKKPPIPQE